MKRLALFAWCVATFCVSIVVTIPISRFTFAHYFETPEWFKESIRSVAYLLFASDTNPESMDIYDANDLVLIILAMLLALVIVIPASVFIWRRLVSRSMKRK
jgi:hypothetical protein